MDIPAHQQRVLTERADLHDKLTKLQVFRETKAHALLEPAEQRLLYRQAIAMRDYRDVLDERIALWGIQA